MEGNPMRQLWAYPGGFIKWVGGNVWVESNPSGSFQFVESSRNDDFIELLDGGRDVAVRLYVTGNGFIRTPESAGQWAPWWTGSWTEQ
jgi:hypothetical protein